MCQTPVVHWYGAQPRPRASGWRCRSGPVAAAMPASALRPALGMRQRGLALVQWCAHARMAPWRAPVCVAGMGGPTRRLSTPPPPPVSPSPSPSPSPALPPEATFKDQNDTWVDRHAPVWARPYLKLMRIDRPIGTWLVLLPGWWGLAYAAPAGELPDLGMMALFGAGAFIVRSAGCTVNDMWDRRFDGQVARTAQRPLASGQVGMFPALVFLGAQSLTGLAILLQLNTATIMYGVACVPLVALYPLMKRVTYAPQLVLGCAMNYGVLMGWAAATGTLHTWPAAALYAGGIAWTLVYDTLYAHQDKADDARLGLRSTALWFKDASPAVLTSLSLVAGACWAVAGATAHLAWPYYAAVAASTAWMAHMSTTALYNDRVDLARKFVANRWVGWIILAGIVAGKLGMEPPPTDQPDGEAEAVDHDDTATLVANAS